MCASLTTIPQKHRGIALIAVKSPTTCAYAGNVKDGIARNAVSGVRHVPKAETSITFVSTVMPKEGF